MTIFADARNSTDSQSVDAQVKALRAAGAEKVFKETAPSARWIDVEGSKCGPIQARKVEAQKAERSDLNAFFVSAATLNQNNPHRSF
jgi:hypothetical protein